MSYTVHIVGNVGRVYDLVTDGDRPWLAFSVATAVRVRGNDETIWTRVVSFGQAEKYLGPHLRKGHRVYVVGNMMPARAYTTNDDQLGVEINVAATRVDILDKKDDSQQSAAPAKRDTPF